MIGGDSRLVSPMFVSELGEWAENTYDKSTKPLIIKLDKKIMDKGVGCLLKFRSLSAVLD